jgi:glycerophosphoryl diester phosphodiesterase
MDGRRITLALALALAWAGAPARAPVPAAPEPGPLVLGHRGLCAHYLENSHAAFRGALAAGLDGFELDVQLSADGVSSVLHDEDFRRTAAGRGRLRRTPAARFPRLNNGEPVPLLAEVARFPARLINVELKGSPGWKEALAAVRAAGALRRVIFSSFDHGEILRLREACPTARCGLLWDRPEARKLDAARIARLPADFTLHLPLDVVQARRAFWQVHGPRLVLWGMGSPCEAHGLGFAPAILISDGP